MNQGSVHKIRELFEAAVSLAPGARETFLDERCGGDTGTKEFVNRMLAADSNGGEILDRSLLSARRREGERLDEYRIVREIGCGGTASVYLAATEKDTAAAPVAIKILHWRALSAEGVRRFAQERAILSRLDHPNIARLTGGGTTEDGHPYFVMEYVDGIPIRQFCLERTLSVRGRLALFRQVCAAVQYAHQMLIVHRDLKPGNILVTVDGSVKLVDFGIAKPLESSGEPWEKVTITGMRPMTPDYASPEQITGGAISTLTDVFSLGVILYELLSGRLPTVRASENPQAFVVSLCRDEPSRPSVAVAETDRDLSRQLKGDIDTIVMRALEKEPARRYQSVEQVNDDVRRYLEGLPVLAQGDTLWYRGRKFLRRHRAGVGAAAAVFVTLVAGIIATSVSARTARLERARAERQSRIAEERRSEAQGARAQAEQEAREAQAQRQNAERRLEAMSQMAQKFISLYNTVQKNEAGDDLTAEVAERTRDSLGLVLKEGVRDASLAAGLASMTESLSSYQDRLAGHWQVPKFWDANETVPREYLVTIDHERVHRGNSSLEVRSIVRQPKGAAAVAQTIRAEGYRGNRIRVNTFLASRGVSSGAELWLRARLPDREVLAAADDPSACRIAGTNSWRECSAQLLVPENAIFIDFGIRLRGAGTIWADDFGFDVSGPIAPVNLGFGLTKSSQ
jgi:hypothetical protein